MDETPPKPIVDLAVLFGKMFKERFELDIKGKRDLASTASPSRGFLRKREDKSFKFLTILPVNLDLIDDEITSFAYQTFRSYESYLACEDGTKENFYRNLKLMTKFNTFIEIMIDAILKYLEENRAQLETNKECSYDEHLSKAFFTHSKLKIKNTKLSDVINNIGIVIFFTDEPKLFARRDSSEPVKYYRLLCDTEVKQLENIQGKDDVAKINKMFEGNFVAAKSDAKNDYKYLLKDFCTADYLRLFKIHTEQKKELQKIVSFDLPDPSYLYVRRSGCESEIKEHLSQDNIAVVVTGLKGSGKTELITKICADMMRDLNIFWIDASTVDSIEKSLRRLYVKTFNRDSIGNLFNDIYKNFQDCNCIFVFDNAESFVLIEKFLPKGFEKFKILITSHSGNWQNEHFQPHIVNVDCMNVDESTKLFQNYINESLERSDFNERCELLGDASFGIVKSLMDTIPRYPLMVKQAAGCIMKKFKSRMLATSKSTWRDVLQEEITSYLDLYNTNRKDLLTAEFKQKDLVNVTNMYTNIVMVIKKLEIDFYLSKDIHKKNVHKNALDVTNMLTFFEATPIFDAVFKPFCGDHCKGEDVDEFYNNIVDLLSNSLIVKHSDESLTMDGTVRLVNKLYLEEKFKEGNGIENILTNCLDCVIRYVNNNDFNKISQHITSAWEYASKYKCVIDHFLSDKEKCLFDIQSTDDDKKKGYTTFFHILCQFSHVEIVKDIVDVMKETDNEHLMCIVNKPNSFHKTPLHCAAEGGNLHIVKLLVDLEPKVIEHANENIEKSPKTKSPLQYAITSGSKDVVDYLIEKGHKCEGVCEDGSTLTQLAARYGSVDLLKLFANKENVNTTDCNGLTSLHFACQQNGCENVKLLIELGVNTKAVTNDGKTALHIAMENGFEKTVDALMTHDRKKSSNIKKKDNNGHIPLHLAVLNDCTLAVDALLSKDRTFVNEKTNEGDTALHLAAKKNLLIVVNVLLKHKANPRIKNNSNELPINVTDDDEIKTVIQKWISSRGILERIFSI